MIEFGGYLPLELRAGQEWYTEKRLGLGMARVNSGRTAILVALRHLGARRVFLPSYYCPSVTDFLHKEGYEVSFYPLGADLLPRLEDCNPQAGDALLLADYFGFSGDFIRELIPQYERVVVDNALAFYSGPVAREGVVSIYSCRKFFGVSDGAYAIGVGVEQPPFETDCSSGRASHLVRSIEFGTNAAYKESVVNEDLLGTGCRLMSGLTRRILDSVDYESVRQARRRNFRKLDDLLAEAQELTVRLPEGAVPSGYPLLTKRPLRQALVARHVYVPRMWSPWIGNSNVDKASAEYLFSNNMSYLPIDQRYDESDMTVLAGIVMDELERMDG